RRAARVIGPRRDVLEGANGCQRRLLDRIDVMHEGISVIFAEGGHLRKARARGKHGAVVVLLELDRIAQRHFSPKSFRALCAAASHPIPIICATCSHARWAAKRAMNSRSRSAACITGPRIALATNAPGGRPPASIP